MMQSVRQIGLILMLILLPATALAIEPPRPGQEDMLIGAVYAEGRLWLLSDADQLFSLSETDTQSRREYPGEFVLGMCLMDGKFTLLAPDKSGSINLRQPTSKGWTSGPPILGSYGERMVAFVCEDKTALIITDKRLITVSNGQIVQTLLTGRKIGIGATTTTLVTKTAVYIGFNLGEWGGGLQKIDRATGTISLIDNSDKGCGGLLNTNCDPVNGLAVLPWRNDCIAAAIGLMHFDGHGRIVTVCNDKIEQLYVKQYGERYPNKSLPPEEAYPTIPFYGLMAVNDQLLAVGADGFYRLSAEGKPAFQKMPKFKKIGPFQVSFSMADVILVLTSVNQRRSVSGPAPMLVAR